MPRTPIRALFVAACAACTMVGQAATDTVVQQAGQAQTVKIPPPQSSTDRDPNQLTFRSSITLVPVDVRVLDRDGKPVTDLKQSDFTILEDNRPQTITHFATHRFDAQAAPPDAKPIFRTRSSSPTNEQSARIFLILLGRGRLQVVSKGIDAAMHLVKNRLLPQDLVAIMAWNRATNFTNDKAKIVQVLDRFKKDHEAIENKLQFQLSGLQAVYGSKAYPDNVQKDIDAVFSGPNAVASRRVMNEPVPVTTRLADDTRLLTDIAQRADVLSNRTPTAGDAFDRAAADMMPLAFDDYVTQAVQVSQDLGNLYTAIEYLRSIEGEKHIVFLTEQGMYLPRAETDTDLTRRANQARVVIDTIQTGGIDPGPPPMTASAISPMPSPAFAAMDMFRIQTLRTMASTTGGQSAAREYSMPAMDRIDTATRFSYLLGYRPANASIDGRFRRIVVRVNRPGLTVLYRHGYYSDEGPAPVDRRVFLTHQRIAGAGNYAKDVEDIRIKVNGSTIKKGDRWTEVSMDVMIDTEHVTFTTAEDRQVAQLNLAIFAGDGKGRVLGQTWHTMDLKLRPATFERYKKEGIPFNVALQAVEKPTYVKLVVYDYGADLVGSLNYKLK